mgnify:CR=1 FL=1
MKTSFKTPLASALVAASLFGSAQAAVTFTEDFTGPTLDAAWTQSGYLAGHLGISSGSYEMTATRGGGGNPKLQQFLPGVSDTSYTHEINVVLTPFFLTGSGGTQSDFKWKTFGPDGFMEIVLNSFGDMRLFHNDFDGGGGNIQPNTNIGISEVALLNLTTNYDIGTDTINVTYALNGGAPQLFYSGGGVDGPIGDTVSNFVEVELFKWGAVPDTPTIAIDGWNLSSAAVIPEPSTSILLAAFLGLAAVRRRR